MRTVTLHLVVAFCVAVLTNQVIAQENTAWNYDPNGQGDWFVDEHWTYGVPDTEDFTFIDNGGQAIIAAPGAVTDWFWIGVMLPNNTLNIQPGGLLTVNGLLCVGHDTVGNVLYQTGGGVVVDYLDIGHDIGTRSSGSYIMEGGTLTSFGGILLGEGGNGVFQHSGGSVLASGGGLGIAFSDKSSGVYHLGPIQTEQSPQLRTTSTYVGDCSVGGFFGTAEGRFYQTGGSHEVEDNLYIGYYDYQNDHSCGWYEISGGALETTNLYIGGVASEAFTRGFGSLQIKQHDDPDVGTKITISETLHFGKNARFLADSGADPTINMRLKPNRIVGSELEPDVDGRFVNESTDPTITDPLDEYETGLAGLGNLALICEFDHVSGCTVGDPYMEFEVAGKDEGAVSAAFRSDNFLLQELILGCDDADVDDDAGGMFIKFVDINDNQSDGIDNEALYANILEIRAGVGFDMDCNVYYRNGGQAKMLIHGDANLDGIVNVGDLGILAANYGSGGMTWSHGDFNGDRMINVGDLGVIAANYGSGGIPEPTTVSLIVLGLLLLLYRRQRR